MPELIIRPATAADAPAVAAFCQPIYALTYPNQRYGLTPEHFSPAIFSSPDTIDYFAGILASSDHQRAYLALEGKDIVGSIGITLENDHYEIHGFYIRTDRQRQEIGVQLLRRVLEFAARDLPIRVEVAETTNARAIYEKWGFRHLPELGVNLRHWPEWPDGLHNGYIFLEAYRKDIHA